MNLVQLVLSSLVLQNEDVSFFSRENSSELIYIAFGNTKVVGQGQHKADVTALEEPRWTERPVSWRSATIPYITVAIQ